LCVGKDLIVPNRCSHDCDHRYRANNGRNISAPLHTALNPCSRELTQLRKHPRTAVSPRQLGSASYVAAIRVPYLLNGFGCFFFRKICIRRMKISISTRGHGASNTRMTVVWSSQKGGVGTRARVGKMVAPRRPWKLGLQKKK